ncbi:MAG: thiopeptide-type bacteriocin biosynthesis protein [Saprospiraceae bacterium]
MGEWVSYRFTPHDSPVVYLVRGLLPFLKTHVWPTPGARAFFLHYEDAGGPHLRLRFFGDAERIRQLFEQQAQGEWTTLPYVPEETRFGGPGKMPWAEEHFHLSSRVVLERLSTPNHLYGDAMFDAMVSNVMMAHLMGFSRSKAVEWFRNLYSQWLPLFFGTEAGAAPEPTVLATVETQFASSLKKQGADLRNSLHILWQQLDQQRIAADRPEWLRWLRGNELILPHFEPDQPQIASSLLHLHSNRLGIHNQDEVFVLYMLANCL